MIPFRLPESHEGPAELRWKKKTLTVLCPFGHVVETYSLQDFAGSTLEAKVSNHQHAMHHGLGVAQGRWMVRCQAPLPAKIADYVEGGYYARHKP